jgi:hypothetical protein
VGTPEENAGFLEALNDVLGHQASVSSTA